MLKSRGCDSTMLVVIQQAGWWGLYNRLKGDGYKIGYGEGLYKLPEGL